MIGIFWVYLGKVFGQAEPVTAGTEAVLGLVDSNLDHVTVWEKMASARHTLPELTGMEYQQVPRGRVLWQRKKSCHLVYLDKTLLAHETRAAIAEFFQFDKSHAVWKSDSHYTTATDELDRLFLE